MKKNIFLYLTTLLFAMTVDAQAQEWSAEDCYCDQERCCRDFYAKIFGGANFLQHTTNSGNKAKYDTGYIIAGSLGYYWQCGLRLEGEYAFRKNTIRSIQFVSEGSSHHGYFQTSSYMANLLWDVPLGSWGCFFWNGRPFIGAGIGYDFQRMHSSNSRIIFSQKWRHFSWQIMTGIAYPIYCNTELTLEYKFHQGGSHFNNHSLGVGLIYNFGFI